MIDVIFHPRLLDPTTLPRSQVVILDILRASTTIVTALHNGARDVRLFNDIPEIEALKPTLPPPVLSAGERHCVRIPGFDLGNSPAEFPTHVVGNATILLSTTNGTRAAVAAQTAPVRFVGSLLNATATAAALLPQLDTLDTRLLCAGTDASFACEDMLGTGAILFALLQQTYRSDLPFTDTAWLCYHAFTAVRQRLPAALRLGQGGINLIDAGLEDDIDRCAALDTIPLVVTIANDPLRALRLD
jgi:2-phosphosulfolactate phosphatase